MCWIFSSGKEGADVSKEQFNNAYCKNNDGAGFMYAKDGELFVEKGFFNFESFYEAYSKIDKKYPRVVHFRASTGGGKTSINCHPFLVNESLGFAHNGTFMGFLSTADHSDTYRFNEEILKPLCSGNHKELYKGHIKWMLEESVGSNKLVFLDKDGESLILNANLGEWDKTKNGAWYSGFGHTYATVIYPNTTIYSKNNGLWNEKSSASPSSYRPSIESSLVKFEVETYDAWINRHYQIYIDLVKKESQQEQLALTNGG